MLYLVSISNTTWVPKENNFELHQVFLVAVQPRWVQFQSPCLCRVLHKQSAEDASACPQAVGLQVKIADADSSIFFMDVHLPIHVGNQWVLTSKSPQLLLVETKCFFEKRQFLMVKLIIIHISSIIPPIAILAKMQEPFRAVAEPLAAAGKDHPPADLRWEKPLWCPLVIKPKH